MKTDKIELMSCQRCYDVIASLRSNPEANNRTWIASSFLLAMTATRIVIARNEAIRTIT